MRAGVEAVRLAVCTEHRRAAARGTHQIEQHADRRRLAGAIQAEESEDLTRRNIERDVAQRRHAPVPLRQTFEPHGGHGFTSHVERAPRIAY